MGNWLKMQVWCNVVLVNGLYLCLLRITNQNRKQDKIVINILLVDMQLLLYDPLNLCEESIFIYCYYCFLETV